MSIPNTPISSGVTGATAPTPIVANSRIAHNWANHKVQILSSGTFTLALAGTATAAFLLGGPFTMVAAIAGAALIALGLFITSLLKAPKVEEMVERNNVTVGDVDAKESDKEASESKAAISTDYRSFKEAISEWPFRPDAQENGNVTDSDSEKDDGSDVEITRQPLSTKTPASVTTATATTDEVKTASTSSHTSVEDDVDVDTTAITDSKTTGMPLEEVEVASTTATTGSKTCMSRAAKLALSTLGLAASFGLGYNATNLLGSMFTPAIRI
jgi:hypothetical protein